MKTTLQLFTDPLVLVQVGHRQVALLIDRLVQLFPGRYQLPATRTDNEGFIEVLTRKLVDPDDLPAPFLQALEEVETLASPENVPNLNIPQNVDPQDPESKPLYHAILAWLSAHPAPVAPPTPARKLPKSGAPREGAPAPESPAPPKSAAPAKIAMPQPVPSISPPVATRMPSGAFIVAPAEVEVSAHAGSPPSPLIPGGATRSDNGSPIPDPALAPTHAPTQSDEPVPSRPGLKLRLSVLFWEIDPLVRREFFSRFEKDLREAFPELPIDSAGAAAFDNAVYALLKRPQFLPEPMRAALLAIQELAAPANRQLLRALATHRAIYCEAQATPEHVAVSYWLKCPFPPGGLDALRASVPRHLLAPTPAKAGANGEATDDEDGLPQPDSAPETAPSNTRHPGDLAAIARFPRNKIAKLPPEVREELNLMLRQRVTYQEILVRLGPRGAGLNRNNLSRWKKTGYLVWLAEQQRREEAQVQMELLFDIVQEKDNAKLHEATQQIAALRISQFLAAFDPSSLTAAFQEHPQAFVRLIQTLPSLSRAGMDCERVLVELSERKAVLDPTKKKQRGISDESLQYITQKINLM